MIIVKVDTLLFRTCRNYLIVRIETADGLVGYGDATLNGRESVVKELIDAHLSEMLVGKDAANITDIWQMIYIGTYWRGGPVTMTALAGIDMALWDLKGKLSGLPLCDLIGGRSRKKMEVYCHVHGTTLEQLIENISGKLALGFRIVRYSFDTSDSESNLVFRQPHQDVSKGHIEIDSINTCSEVWDSRMYAADLIRITRAIREEFGPHLGLIHDVHSRLTVAQARQTLKQLESLGLLFIEDPIDSKNLKGLSLLSQCCTVPIGIGELFNTIDECRDIIAHQEIGFLRIDISHFGGITPALRAAAVAEAFGVKVAFHGPSDISPLAHAACYHIDASIPNFGVQEYVNFEPEVLNVFQIPYAYQDGYITIDNTPGLGVTIDESLIDTDSTYIKSYLPILRDRMDAVHNW